MALSTFSALIARTERSETGRTASPRIKQTRRGTTPAAAFLSRLADHHDLSEAELLVDSFGYRTALSRLGLSGQVEYRGRNHIERWFQTLKQRTDRFYIVWNSGPASTRRWLQRFVHYYNHDRPNQALNGQIPAEVA